MTSEPLDDGKAADASGAAAERAGSGRAARWFLAVGALALLLIAGACWWTVERARGAAVADAENRLNLIAEGRADLVRAWRDGVLRDARRFTDSQFLRAFAADRLAAADADAKRGGDDDAGAAADANLDARRDYLRNLARDFVERTRFTRLVVVDPAGAPLLGSAARVGAVPQAPVARALRQAAPAYGEARTVEGAVRVVLALPVIRPQQDASPDSALGAVLLELPVAPVVRQATRLPDLAAGTETIHLLADTAEGTRALQAGGLAEWPVRGVDGAGDLAFTRAARDGRPVFVAAQGLDGPAWTLAVSTPVSAALAGYRDFARAAVGVAVGIALAVLGGLAGGWYRLSAAHATARAESERAFARRIERERRLLDQITGSVSELIGLKGPDGAYVYANRALADWAGRAREQLTGADDATLFGPTLAGRLAGLDADARQSGRPASAMEPVYQHGQRRYLRFTVQPFEEAGAAGSGSLLVATDLTEIVAAEEARRADLDRTVTALGRAVEAVDPYLAGHSRRVQRLGEAVARQLRLSESEVTTVALAARLSQIGKLGVRRALLAAAERHGPEEVREMQQHIEHAERILREIAFHLPVRATVVQMHERLDGSGYPQGLSGTQIRREARILGAVDVFCARIEPRAYRPAIAADEALAVLRAHPERYDAEVVAALAQVLASPEGEKALAGLDA